MVSVSYTHLNKVAIGLMFTFILYPKVGPFVKLLEFFGLNSNVNVLGNMDTSIWVCAFVVLWCNTGLHMILFSAAMTSIPAEIYESAKIDGATPFQKLRYITLPLLKGAINMSAILLLTNAFRVFDLIAALTDEMCIRDRSVSSGKEGINFVGLSNYQFVLSGEGVSSERFLTSLKDVYKRQMVCSPMFKIRNTFHGVVSNGKIRLA